MSIDPARSHDRQRTVDESELKMLGDDDDRPTTEVSETAVVDEELRERFNL